MTPDAVSDLRVHLLNDGAETLVRASSGTGRERCLYAVQDLEIRYTIDPADYTRDEIAPLPLIAGNMSVSGTFERLYVDPDLIPELLGERRPWTTRLSRRMRRLARRLRAWLSPRTPGLPNSNNTTWRWDATVPCVN